VYHLSRRTAVKSFPIPDDLKQSLIPMQDDPENGWIGVSKPLGNVHQNANSDSLTHSPINEFLSRSPRNLHGISWFE
jgi:hypothetical protein